MAWLHLHEDIVLDFLEEQERVEQRFVAHVHQPVESFRRAYRERQLLLGKCRSCRRPTVDGLRVCAVHRDAARARARASEVRRRAAGTFEKRR